jgi:hypothetical protein
MSPPRKFSGKVKPGMGIDGTEGESFTRGSQDPWTQESNYKEKPNYPGKYSDNDKILRNKEPDGPGRTTTSRKSGGGDARDIYDNVDRNSDDVSKTGGTGPIRFGVD